MKSITLFLSLFAQLGATALSGETNGSLFDLAAIRDTSTLETAVLQDWRPAEGDPSIRQKLVEITVCEWWPGQRVRIPVTLNAPSAGPVCENLLVVNMAIATKPEMPKGVPLELLKNHGVGIVMVGMGTIDEMQPAGQLHRLMQRKLLDTKDPRFSATWIWGMSQMRGLTAAIAEPEAFRPQKVLATGGSKRGVASAIAGIWDERFTAIMPVVAPPLGNPGGPMVIGSESEEVVAANAKFYRDLDAGTLGLDPGIRTALEGRVVNWSKERITLPEAEAARWTADDIAGLDDRIWEMSHIVHFLPEVERRGLAYFYNAGTNDSVTPNLRELGALLPGFPIYIVPGGQHGGPNGAGYTRRVPLQPEVQSNLRTFARHHFFGDRTLVATPDIRSDWDTQKGILTVEAIFADGTEPEANDLWWCLDKNAPKTLPFEYDAWQSIPMRKTAPGRFQVQTPINGAPDRIDLLTVHTHTENGLPLTFSSGYHRMK